jgi:hypothetical protein
MLTEGVGAEPWSDDAGGSPEQDVRAAVGAGGRGHHRPDRLQQARQRRRREQGKVSQHDGQRVGVGDLLLHLVDGGEQPGILFDDRPGTPASRDLEDCLVRRDDPRLPAGDLHTGVQHVLEHGER